MSKSSKITASELVLSAIFFLQQKNGVTARDLTKFICEKRRCKQSLVRSEVKKALERATENGIFSKKRGLYRIESGFGKNKITIKVNRGTQRNKRVRKMKRSTSSKPADEEAFGDPADAPLFAPAVHVPPLSSRKSHTKHTCPGRHFAALPDGLQGKASVRKILMQHTKCPKKAYEDDDDDEEEDFFEEDEDEDDVDYFADDQFPSPADAVKEYPPSESEQEPEPKKRATVKRKAQSRSKSRTKGKSKKRKLSKPKRKVGRRRRNTVVRKCKKQNHEPVSDDENKQNTENAEEDDENMELDSQAEDNDGEDEYAENDGPDDSDYELEDERNQEDYDYGDDDYASEEEYLKKHKKNSKGNKEAERGDAVPKREGGQEGDKKDANTTQNVKVSVKTTAEGKGSADGSPATPKPQEAGGQDKKSKPIRSSSLFSSFKKKNESKNSAVDRKQVKSGM